MGPPPAFNGNRQRPGSGYGPGPVLAQGNPLSLVPPAGSDMQPATMNNATGNVNQCMHSPNPLPQTKFLACKRTC